jgi:hypothetical protein
MDLRLQQRLLAGPATAQELGQLLGISQPSVSRLLRQYRAELAVIGAARSTRYALRKPLRDLPADMPVQRIDRSGRASLIGVLNSVHGGLLYEDVEQRSTELYDGLPWFLADMRPQGFLGRGFSRRYPELGLPTRITDWTDEHVLYALARRSEDEVGNLLVGEESFARWHAAPPLSTVIADQRAQTYPQLAERALVQELAGSSAGGEHPKFAALIVPAGSDTAPSPDDGMHVLVKFSEPLDTGSGERWGDLLRAEHLALDCLREAGLPAAHSRLIAAGNRVFLEVERFDRIGARGRAGLMSLGTVDDQFVGRRRRWHDTALELQRQALLSDQDVDRIGWLEAFGACIANSDMHFGNLSLLYEGRMPLRLAPAYDMLPMAYAPQRGEVRTPDFRPASPPLRALEAARAALQAARIFWQRLEQDENISAAFRSIAAVNEKQLGLQRW